MINKLNEIFEANSLGFSVYDKDAIILQVSEYIKNEKRNMLISFCDNVIWKEKREHIHTQIIDEFLIE